MLLGINFHGYKCASYQSRPNTRVPPEKYIDDSFNIFSQTGLKCIRVPIYWESYERNPQEFNEEIDNISDAETK